VFSPPHEAVKTGKEGKGTLREVREKGFVGKERNMA